MNAIDLCAIRAEINRRASRDPRISMQNGKSYDRQLRNIGQSLEAQRIIVFELSHQGDDLLSRENPKRKVRCWPHCEIGRNAGAAKA
jgi:hypothetical protein